MLTLLLGPYIGAVAKAAAGADGFIHPFGFAIDPRSWWSYMVSCSVILQVVTLPLVGAIADHTRRKKQLLAAFAGVGALATMCLFFVQGTAYLLGGGLFVLANVAFGASMVVYNSFLLDIAKPEERDSVSSRGWAFGYLGGGIALALNLVLFGQAKNLGISEGMAARINLAFAGVWWAFFGAFAIAMLRNREPRLGAATENPFRRFFTTLREMRNYPQALRFLIAYLLYNDAVQAVIALSGQFGHDELKIEMSTLAVAILMVQFVAFLGALLFNLVARVVGSKRAILLSLVIWAGALTSVYVSVRTTAGFFAMAAVVGVVLGGTQALSRSLFSQLIPPGKEAEYFGVYELSDKGTSWMAPLFFGIMLQRTGNYRLSILSLLIFFALGFVFLLRVRVPRVEAG